MLLFKKRFLAYIADYFVVSAIMWIIAKLLIIVFPFTKFLIYEYLFILAPIVVMVYFVVLETKKGTTVGKYLLYLKVVSTVNESCYSNITYKQGIIRNISKIYWIPIIVDLVIGLLVGSSDERILGRVSKTEVVMEIAESNKKKP